MATTERTLRALTGKDNLELLRWLDEQFERCRKSRLSFEKDWYMSLAFYFGKQYVQWTTSLATLGAATGNYSRLWEPPAPPWRVRLIANRIRPLIRTELSKVVKERPNVFVVPSTTEDEDLNAAKAAEALWEHFYFAKQLRKRVRQAAFWSLLCGTAYIKNYWDDKKKDDTGITGDIAIEAVTPFHILVPDTQCEDIEDQPYVIHYMAKSPDWVKQRFGKEIRADASGSPTILEQKFFNALGISPVKNEYTVVKEIWIKPGSTRFPQGAVVSWAGEELLSEPYEGWPYEHEEYPFIKFDHIPTGRFYADSTIPDLIPLQKEYNRTRSQIIEAKNKMAKPQLLAPRGSINPNAITSEPGLIIQYTPGFTPPTPLQLSPLPGYVTEELERIVRDMDDISGQHEITKGRTPPGVTAATAIAYLQEEDDSKIATTIDSLEEGVEKLGRQILHHVNQFWSIERKIRIIGENGQLETFALSAATLKGNVDLRVEAGSATPRSRAAKQAFITELGKMGWIPPNRALKYLDMAETARLYEEMQIDTRHAQRENLKLAAGAQVQVNNFDNDQVHVEEHDTFRKKQQYENLDPQIQMMFDQHVQAHQQQLLYKQQAMMAGIPVSGAPVAPGQPARVSVGAESALSPEFFQGQ